jgi:SAM-dependent methyltransferase
VAKNVLVYVDEPLKTYQECHRVLRNGGRVHAIESDWDFTLAEPVPEEDWKALIRAASIAFRTPTIGRQMHKVARAAGFADVTVSVVCYPDTTGQYLPMVRNLCSYARQGGALEEQKIDAILNRCEDAANSQELLILTPQFVVTATR